LFFHPEPQTPSPHMSTHTSPDGTVPSWTSAQWEAISSAHRLQLLQFIEGAGRATIKDLSGWTGRTGTSLYPHLEILEAAHLLSVEIEVGKGRPRRVYMPGPATAWNRQSTEQSSDGHSSISLGAQLLSDLALRLRRWGKARMKKAVEARDLRNAALVSETTWLDDQQLQEVNAKVNELMSFVREARAQRRGKRHNVAVYHFPDVTLREARDGVTE
jgi:hypothetical protein